MSSEEIDWNSLMESNLIDKQSLNHLILNYLIFEGYENSTIKFAKEIGINLDNEVDEQGEEGEEDDEPIKANIIMGLNSIKIRNEIKLNILNGEIQLGINKLNLNYPDLLEQNNFLYFKLLLLNLIEMIRKNRDSETSIKDDEPTEFNQEEFVLKIIKFAQEKLTNKAIKNVKFMEELELTMTLLLYSTNDSNLLPLRLNELFEFKLRRDIADLVNKSILVNDSNNLIDLNYKKNFMKKRKLQLQILVIMMKLILMMMKMD
ncbi:hypothetical protein BN7_3020 [Wickerhamomyces ciferrii]|uniref:CTLH domain-containing protein n=1 Tax=Wickerhamomyces ciferrii (strain ATCC 14091 / BCRC 22168 / CBS 111 / JCM 3599 / NBRC 0793 / NRRL Y-1031 F-60-10) TaxID=1206466 RepID=K0KEB6_WICCF|nr:uncharacterized protein BN7_3020 [Wickerhamomyces ciferrii]CCH43470.1 hypothetical protein BN7_3020 [Wickerhamomyces ciferrii]